MKPLGESSRGLVEGLMVFLEKNTGGDLHYHCSRWGSHQLASFDGPGFVHRESMDTMMRGGLGFINNQCSVVVGSGGSIQVPSGSKQSKRSLFQDMEGE